VARCCNSGDTVTNNGNVCLFFHEKYLQVRYPLKKWVHMVTLSKFMDYFIAALIYTKFPVI
jgi:hypothetical protein